MISGKILKTHGWPEGKVIGLAKDAAEALEAAGLERDAVLAWLESVRADPGTYLADPKLAPLARECLRRDPSDARDAARAPAALYGLGRGAD